MMHDADGTVLEDFYVVPDTTGVRSLVASDDLPLTPQRFAAAVRHSIEQHHDVVEEA
jgi:hypothetical protein